MSVHIWVAPPIVYHDISFLTKLFSSYILLTENFDANVTANGRPYGIATIRIVNPYKKNLKHKETSSTLHPPIIPLVMKYLKNKTTIVIIAIISPSFPIFYATASNFNYKGVISYSSWVNDYSIFPWQDLLPTATIKNFP